MQNLDFPKGLLKTLASLLSQKDLAQCTLVCNRWRNVFTPFSQERQAPGSFERQLDYKNEANDLFFQERRQSILAALKNSFPISRNLSVEMIKISGASPKGQTYKIGLNGEFFALRVLHKPANQNNVLDNAKEMLFFNFFSALNISPLVHYVDLNAGILLTEFIQSQTAWQQNLNQDILSKLALQLRKVHNSSLHLLPKREIRSCGLYLERISTTQKLLANNSRFHFYQEALTQYTALEKLIISQSMTHGDLTSGNAVFDGHKVYLIDWESAGLGDPLFDLAALVLHFHLSPEQERFFLESYYQVQTGEYTKARYFVAKQLVLLRYSLSLFGNLPAADLAALQVDVNAIVPFSSLLTTKPKVEKAAAKATMGDVAGRLCIAISLFKEAMGNLSSTAFIEARKLILNGIRGQEKLLSKLRKDSLFPKADKLPDTLIDKIFQYLVSDKSTSQKAAQLSKAWHVKLLEQYRLSRLHQDFSLIGLDCVDETYRHPIERAIQAAFQYSPKQTYTIEALPGGYSDKARIFKIQANNREYVLRLVLSGRDKKFLSREFGAMDFFGRHGSSPFVQYHNLNSGCIIIDFVRKQKNWFKDLSTLELMSLTELILSVASFKNMPLAQFVSTTPFQFEDHRKFEQRFYPFTAFRCLIEAREKLEAMRQALAPIYCGEICHGDLNPGNLLLDFGKKAYLIDFEDLFRLTGLFDIATLVLFKNIDPFRERLMLMTYFGTRLSADHMAEYFLHKTFACLHFAIRLSKNCDFSAIQALSNSVESIKKFSACTPYFPDYTPMGLLKLSVMLAKEGLHRYDSIENEETLRKYINKPFEVTEVNMHLAPSLKAAVLYS